MSFKSNVRYAALPDQDEEGLMRTGKRPKHRWNLFYWLRALIAILILLSTFLAGAHYSLGWRHDQWSLASTYASSSGSCRNATVRREWRSLSKDEKLEYLQAAKCLTQLESHIAPGQTAHDDFAWVHARFGEYSHGKAAFLTWHRYFIHIYEKTLQERCGFSGTLPYWDWSLDWENIPAAPVWDVALGFGGDGNSSDAESVSFGHCVTEGFFGRLKVANFGPDVQPHCLSRGFLSNETELRRYGHNVSPEVLERLLRKDSYHSFNLGLEHFAHNSIPFTVRGDFYRFTAPNDPLFFLHHAQLDRMLWRWQMRSPERRRAYNDRPVEEEDGSIRSASPTDPLDLGPLAPPIQVADILASESDLLCYRY